MIFLTVGTQFPFDRLVEAVDQAIDDGVLKEEVFAQIGRSKYKPRNFKAVQSLDKSAFDRYIREADRIIGHAGMGTIISAMDHDKPLLVMPRLRRHREVVNDHQKAIAKQFEKQQFLLVAYHVDDLYEKMKLFETFEPMKRHAQIDGIVQRISEFLDDVAKAKIS